jgi:hypothetical protein
MSADITLIPGQIDRHNPLPAARPYSIAMGYDGHKHAVPRAEAFRTYAIAAATDVAPRERNWTVAGLCGVLGNLVTKWGPFAHGNPDLNTSRCPTCGWQVAVAEIAIQEELDALMPGRDVLPAFARLLADPAPASTICEAIVTAATSDETALDLDAPLTVQLLAHVAAHAPMLLVSEACKDDECHHEPADAPQGWRCSFPDARVACPVCSVTAGSWAGEHEGEVLDQCTVLAPCAVLIAAAEHYGLDITGPRPEARS